MSTIYKKEMRQLFTGMMGFIFIAFLFALVGIFFWDYSLKALRPDFESVFSVVTFLYLLIIPILTMRSLADERRMKTDQLLLTSPISLHEIVLAKFYAMSTVLVIPSVVFMFYPVILSQFGNVNYAAAFSGILAFLFMGLLFVSVGIFISSLTESQIISAVITFIVLFAAFLMPVLVSFIEQSASVNMAAFTVVVALVALLLRTWTKNTAFAVMVGLGLEIALLAVFYMAPTLLEGAFSTILMALSPFDKANDIFRYGLLDFKAYIYYLSGTFLFLFLTVQSLEKRRLS